MSSIPDDNLTPAESERLRALEAIADRGRGAYVEVRDALAEIRDAELYRGTHATFAAYLRDRWALDARDGYEIPPPVATPRHGRLPAAAIHLFVHDARPPATSQPKSGLARSGLAGGPLLPQLRWLLNESAGTIAAAAHEVETGDQDIEEDAREQLWDDILAIEDELTTLKALLAGPVDWDAEYGRLLAGEIAPLDDEEDQGGGSPRL